MYSVYKHTSPSGKVYIGVTKQNPYKRWQNGLGYRTQTRFYRAILKYGWDNFTHEIIYQTDSYGEANLKEKELISLHKSTDKEYGYNLDGGGNLKKTISDETKQKLRKIHLSSEYRKKISAANVRRWSDPMTRKKMSERMSGQNNPMYGKKLTEEHKQKISEACRKVVYVGRWGKDNPMYGKHLSDEHKRLISERNRGGNNGRARRVRCVDTQTTYDSIRDAYRATGVRYDSISRVCRGKGETAGGYRWEYVEEV